VSSSRLNSRRQPTDTTKLGRTDRKTLLCCSVLFLRKPLPRIIYIGIYKAVSIGKYHQSFFSTNPTMSSSLSSPLPMTAKAPSLASPWGCSRIHYKIDKVCERAIQRFTGPHNPRTRPYEPLPCSCVYSILYLTQSFLSRGSVKSRSQTHQLWFRVPRLQFFEKSKLSM
jgi:hypothetical protein